MKQRQKLTLQLLIGAIMSFCGLVLLWLSLFLPPKGIIDATVLAAFGEISTFSGALIGIDYSYRFKTIKYLTDKDEKETK